MKILSTTVFRGPNIYALFPVIRHTLDLAELEDWPTGRLGTEFVDDLVERLPGLKEHGCSYREPGGFIRRMREDEGTWLGHVMEHVAIELQNIAGAEVSFGKTRSTDEHGQYDLVYQYQDEQVGLEAGRLAIELLHYLLPRDLRPRQRLPTVILISTKKGTTLFVTRSEERWGPAPHRWSRRPRNVISPGSGSTIRA